MSASQPGDRPDDRTRTRRVDAEENRRRLLAVARDALDHDRAATTQSIAKAAGVGQGTVYRHFPTRADLLAEVYRDDFERLVGSAGRLLDELPPVGALRAWFDELAVFGRHKHALAEVLDAATKAELHNEQVDRTTDAIRALLDAGVRSGGLRAGVTPDEVLALTGFLWHLDTRSDPRIPRLLDLVVDALRVRPSGGG